MSLYGDYIKERENRHIVESEDGFMTYTWLEDACYIVDMYVRPQARKSGLAIRMADVIACKAKERGINMLLGSVDPSTNHATESMRLLIKYGFELGWVKENLIFLRKEI